jgi:hypothetical protein
MASKARTPTNQISEREILMRHRFAKGAVGLAAGIAAICLLALPAPALTATIEFVNSTTGTPGNITVYNADEEVVTSVPVPGTGLPCSTGSNLLTVVVTGNSSTTSGSGTISIAFNNYCSSFTTGPTTSLVYWCSFTTGTWSGPWTHAATSVNTYTSNLTGTLSVILRKDTGTTKNCHTVTTTFCTITTSALTITGIVTSPGMELLTSATGTVGGSSNVGDLLVTGTATNCGVFIAANNGFASISAHVHVV